MLNRTQNLIILHPFVVMLFIVILSLVATIKSTILYAGGGRVSGCTVYEDPCTFDAAASELGEGDTLFIVDGDYNDVYYVDIPVSCTIVGESRENVVFNFEIIFNVTSTGVVHLKIGNFTVIDSYDVPLVNSHSSASGTNEFEFGGITYEDCTHLLKVNDENSNEITVRDSYFFDMYITGDPLIDFVTTKNRNSTIRIYDTEFKRSDLELLVPLGNMNGKLHFTNVEFDNIYFTKSLVHMSNLLDTSNETQREMVMNNVLFLRSYFDYATHSDFLIKVMSYSEHDVVDFVDLTFRRCDIMAHESFIDISVSSSVSFRRFSVIDTAFDPHEDNVSYESRFLKVVSSSDVEFTDWNFDEFEFGYSLDESSSYNLEMVFVEVEAEVFYLNRTRFYNVLNLFLEKQKDVKFSVVANKAILVEDWNILYSDVGFYYCMYLSSTEQEGSYFRLKNLYFVDTGGSFTDRTLMKLHGKMMDLVMEDCVFDETMGHITITRDDPTMFDLKETSGRAVIRNVTLLSTEPPWFLEEIGEYVWGSGGFSFSRMYRYYDMLKFHNSSSLYSIEEWVSSIPGFVSDFYDQGITIENSRFIGCYGFAGSAIQMHEHNILEVVDCVFEDCYSEVSGGAIFVEGSSYERSATGPALESIDEGLGLVKVEVEGYQPLTFGLVIRDSDFRGNYAEEFGGSMFVDGGDVYTLVDGCHFEGGNGGWYGMDIHVQLSKGFKIQNCVFDGTYYEDGYSTMYVKDVAPAAIDMIYCDFVIENTTMRNIRGIRGLFSQLSAFDITNSRFENMEGAVMMKSVRKRRYSDPVNTYDKYYTSEPGYSVLGLPGEVVNTFWGITFKNITMGLYGESGGVLHLTNSRLSPVIIKDCDISDVFLTDHISSTGGVFYFSDLKLVTMINVKVNNVEAAYGAFIAFSGTQFSFEDCHLMNASATSGPVFYDLGGGYTTYVHDTYTIVNLIDFLTIGSFLTVVEGSIHAEDFSGRYFSSVPSVVNIVSIEKMTKSVEEVFLPTQPVSAYPGEGFDVRVEFLDFYNQTILYASDQYSCLLWLADDDDESNVYVSASNSLMMVDIEMMEEFIFEYVRLQEAGDGAGRTYWLEVDCTQFETVNARYFEIELVECTPPNYGLDCLEKISNARFETSSNRVIIVDYEAEDELFFEMEKMSMLEGEFNCSELVGEMSILFDISTSYKCEFLVSSDSQYYTFTEYLKITIYEDWDTEYMTMYNSPGPRVFGEDFRLVLKTVTSDSDVVSLEVSAAPEDEDNSAPPPPPPPNASTTWMVVTFPSAFVVSLIVVCCLCCCFCWVLCCGCLCVCCCGSVSSCALFESQRKIKKFGELEDFDILLSEQQASKDTSIAHININKEMFQIPYEEVTIVKILGEGGSNSTVFEAKWGGQIVAFKCFKTRTLCDSQERFDEFQREVDIFSSLSHPNILRFFGACLHPPRVGILMEFCSNGDLQIFIKERIKKEFKDQGGYPVKEKCRMITEILSALDYIHCRSIIHRDIKPENILLNEMFQTKLMDFGLSKMVDRMSQAKTSRIGTSIYMSPEVTVGENYDEKCDVFSMGIMIWVMCTENDNPYEAGGYQIELRVANDPSFRPDISKIDEVLSSSGEEKSEEKDFGWLKKSVVDSWDHNPECRPTCGELFKIFEENGLE